MALDNDLWRYENQGRSALVCHAAAHWRGTDAAITFFQGPQDAVEADELLLGARCRKQCSGIHSVVVKDEYGRVRVRPSVHNPLPEAAESQLGREQVRHETQREWEDAQQEQQERAAARAAAKAQPKGVSGVRGVYRSTGGSWAASIYHDHQRFYLGAFSTVEEAADAVRRKRVELGIEEDQ